MLKKFDSISNIGNTLIVFYTILYSKPHLLIEFSIVITKDNFKIKILEFNGTKNETDHVRHNYFDTHENDYILLYINEVQNYKQMKNLF